MFDPVRPAPTPWEVAETTLPPHDLEIFAADGAVVARWDGEILDELGTRERLREDFERIAAAVNAEHENEQLMSMLDCHAGFCSHHVPCNGPVARHRDPKTDGQRSNA